MSRAVGVTVRRDDGASFDLPPELWGGTNSYYEFGLYVAVACWSKGAPLRDILAFNGPMSSMGENMRVLQQLVESGHLEHRLGRNGGRYFALRLTEVTA